MMKILKRPIDPDVAMEAMKDLSSLVKKNSYDDWVASLEAKWKVPFGELPAFVQRFDESGREILDPTPIEIPTDIKSLPTIGDQLNALVRAHLDSLAQQAGVETADEAMDLDPEDDEDPVTPYEKQGLLYNMTDEVPEDERPQPASNPPAGEPGVRTDAEAKNNPGTDKK